MNHPFPAVATIALIAATVEAGMTAGCQVHDRLSVAEHHAVNVDQAPKQPGGLLERLR